MIREKEKILLQKIKRSDIDAFQTIFYHYQPVLFDHILYLTDDQDLTDDIVQEVFYRVWINRGSLNPQKSFYGYITKIGINLLRDHYKREKVRIKHRDTLGILHRSEKEDPEEALNVKLLDDAIKDAVHKFLPQKCRTIFLLSRIEGKSNDEIAEILQISKKTVVNQLYFALKIIRKKLAHFF